MPERTLLITWLKGLINEDVPAALREVLDAHHDNYWQWQVTPTTDYTGRIRVTFRAAVEDVWERDLRNELARVQKRGNAVRELSYA
jgi:hypothetical protein